jgi:tetratricopeptide (TPR) repeat protein
MEPANPLYARAIASIYQRKALIYGTVDPNRSVILNEKGLAMLEGLPPAMRAHAVVMKGMAGFYGNLGWSFGQMKKFPEAHQMLDRYGAILEKLYAAEPADQRATYDLTDFHRTKGIIYGYEGKRKVAVEEFARAAALHDELLKVAYDPNTQYLRAELARRMSEHLAALGDKAGARTQAEDALNRMRQLIRAPQPNANHLQETAYLLLSVSDESLRNPKEALEYMRKSVSLQPNDPALNEVLAQALLANGEFEEAERIVSGLVARARARNAGSQTRQLDVLEDLQKQINEKRKAAGL